MNNKTKFTEGEWEISWSEEMNNRTVARLTNKMCIVADAYVSDDPIHDAHLIKTAPKLYAMLVQLQIEGGLGVARHRQVDRLLAEARGEA